MDGLVMILVFIVQLSLLIRSYEQAENSQWRSLKPPIVINTWNFTDANKEAWTQLEGKRSALDAIEVGCSRCEVDQCDGTVGYGGDPSENGEVTLDAMIMDGESYDVGAVGGLRRIRQAISVARMVLERTEHTLLIGRMATDFALQMGFKETSLSTNLTDEMIKNWRANRCQPNYWRNVKPDPKTSCGPYKPIYALFSTEASRLNHITDIPRDRSERGHDTIGMVAIDSQNRIASGTSTNGLKFKIPGRVGDSPIPGAGSYAAKEAGAAAATGDGDVIMRFLLSYQAVENLRLGMSAQQAATDVIMRQVRRTGKPYPQAAVVVLSRTGLFGAACSGFARFPFVVSDSSKQTETYVIDCIQ